VPERNQQAIPSWLVELDNCLRFMHLHEITTSGVRLALDPAAVHDFRFSNGSPFRLFLGTWLVGTVGGHCLQEGILKKKLHRGGTSRSKAVWGAKVK
jgi:hypothetical protein